jgi:glyoxylase I family protein
MRTIQRLSHVGLCVTDLERAVRFYRDLLGFAEEHRLEVAGEPTDRLLRLHGTQLRAVYLLRDGVRLELLRFDAPPAPPRHERVLHEPGLTHLSFRVDDLEATLAALRADGQTVLEDTVLSFPEWQSGAAFVRDPDGQLIELVQAPGDPSKPPGVH